MGSDAVGPFTHPAPLRGDSGSRERQAPLTPVGVEAAGPMPGSGPSWATFLLRGPQQRVASPILVPRSFTGASVPTPKGWEDSMC